MSRRHDIAFVCGIAVLSMLVIGFSGSLGAMTAGVLCLGLAIIVYCLYDLLLLKTLLEVLLALALLVVPAALFIWYVIIELPDPPYPRGHLIIATGVSVGWIATWFTTEYRRARERRGGAVDLAVALRSEISVAVQTLDDTDWDAQHETYKDKIAAASAENPYISITLTESPAVVFGELAGSLELLSPGLVVRIIEFYASLTDLQTVVKDVQTHGGPETEDRLRIALHQRLTNTRRVTLRKGVQALYELNDFLGEADPAGKDALPRTGKNSDIQPEMKAAKR